MTKKFFLIVGLLMLWSCGNQAIPSIESNATAQNNIAPALADVWTTTIEVVPDSRIGQPFDVVFSITPHRNAHDVTIDIRLPAEVELIGGVPYQTNLILTGGVRHEIPLKLKVMKVSRSTEINFISYGYYDDGLYMRGSSLTYLTDQNGVIVQTTSLPDLRPTRVPGGPPPVLVEPTPLYTEPYITDDVTSVPRP